MSAREPPSSGRPQNFASLFFVAFGRIRLRRKTAAEANHRPERTSLGMTQAITGHLAVSNAKVRIGSMALQ